MLYSAVMAKPLLVFPSSEELRRRLSILPPSVLQSRAEAKAGVCFYLCREICFPFPSVMKTILCCNTMWSHDVINGYSSSYTLFVWLDGRMTNHYHDCRSLLVDWPVSLHSSVPNFIIIYRPSLLYLILSEPLCFASYKWINY